METLGIETITLEVTCKSCGKLFSITVNKQDLIDWKSGQLIQSVMPYLTSDQRELLMTNTCSDCWNRLLE